MACAGTDNGALPVALDAAADLAADDLARAASHGQILVEPPTIRMLVPISCRP